MARREVVLRPLMVTTPLGQLLAVDTAAATHVSCGGEGFVAGGVAVDDDVGQHAAEADGHRQQKADDGALQGILVLASLAEECSPHLAEGIAETTDGVVGVVGASEGVVAGDSGTGERSFAVGALPAVEHDRVAREEHRRDDDHVPGVQQDVQRVVIQPADGVCAEAEQDERAPGEPRCCHDGTHPGDEAAPATGVLGFDPGIADGVCVPETDGRVEQPESDDEDGDQCSSLPNC